MKYRYKAQNTEKIIQEGIIEAETKGEAIKTLQNHGLVVFSLIAEEDVRGFSKEVKIPFLNRIKQKDLVIFSRELATLVEGKVSLVEALKSLARQTSNPNFRDVIAETAQAIEGGSLLSKALGKHPKVFSDFYMNLIQSSEVSGTLEQTLLYLADYEEQKHETVSKIKGAMMYPVFILIFMVAIGVFAMVSIVPKLTDMLLEAEVELPFMTKMIIAISDFLVNYWYVAIIGSVGFVYGFLFWIRSESGGRAWGKIVLKIPVFGTILKQFYLNRIAENLKTLLRGGISILRSLEVSASIIGNSVYRDIILETREGVRGGKNMSSIFETYKEFPPMFTEMVKVGEKSGSVDNMFEKLAIFYKKEVDNVVENISKLIEPFLIVLIGLGVATLVSAIILPIYKMSEAM